MKIKIWNSDFGNSTNNFLVDGYYFEIPTNVVEITANKADELFVNPITEAKQLKDRLAITTEIEGEEKYFLVGEIAESSKLSNNHVGKMHDKIKSVIPYASFLAGVAYYNELNSDKDETEVEIEYMSCMLPIWLLKREEKFSIAQRQMEERFIGEHVVKIITKGMEKEIKIIVKNTRCKIESEVARYAIKYKMVADDEDKNTINIIKRNNTNFSNVPAVLSDIGGGSIDDVKIGKGLTTPETKDDFQVIDITPFLGSLEQLRKEKLIEHFHDLRALEKFIVKNYEQRKYVLKDENIGKNYDFTDIINQFLLEYAEILVPKILSAFTPEADEVLKYIYFGGEAPILEPFIKQVLLKYMSDTAIENNHFFLNMIIDDDEKEVFKPTSRTINLIALEILALLEMKNSNEKEEK